MFRQMLPREFRFLLSLLFAPILSLYAQGDDVASRGGPSANAPTQIVLVGDSTVGPSDGWGPGFAELLRPSARCWNAALNGRSSRSFRDEGHWDKITESPGDYVLIQFGHNDQPGKGPDRESDPETNFRDHLRAYVRDARSVGMTPILVTPLTRRRWNGAGQIESILHAYASATRDVASELNAPLIDLHALSIRHCNAWGPQRFQVYEPVTDKGMDHTHLNRTGSRAVAKLVAAELSRVVPELSAHIRPLDRRTSTAAGIEELTTAAGRPRLLVLTDIGGDPDDRQSMIRLMVYANEFEIEGLVASASGTPGELKDATIRPDLIREIISAYGQVRDNLASHAPDWPTAETLLARVKAGNSQRGTTAVGADHDTEGSQWIIDRVDAGGIERPLCISIWGGQTDLAQALWRVREDRGATGLAEFIRQFRVYDIADQDGIAGWMQQQFPGMFYVLSKAPPGQDRRDATFRGMYLTGDESLTSQEWIDQHIRGTGPLGALYPTKTWTSPNPHGCMKEGDTPSWFFFLPLGGNEPDFPTQPGWGGQFQVTPDGWYPDARGTDVDVRHAVSQWRSEFQHDFARRMGWCRP